MDSLRNATQQYVYVVRSCVSIDDECRVAKGADSLVEELENDAGFEIKESVMPSGITSLRSDTLEKTLSC